MYNIGKYIVLEQRLGETELKEKIVKTKKPTVKAQKSVKQGKIKSKPQKVVEAKSTTKKAVKDVKKTLKVRFLGGVGEIGKKYTRHVPEHRSYHISRNGNRKGQKHLPGKNALINKHAL